MQLVNALGLSSENQQHKSLRSLRNLSNITLALNVFALGTSSHVFVLRLALKNGLERKNYAQFFALVPDVDISRQIDVLTSRRYWRFWRSCFCSRLDLYHLESHHAKLPCSGRSITYCMPFRCGTLNLGSIQHFELVFLQQMHLRVQSRTLNLMFSGACIFKFNL